MFLDHWVGDVYSCLALQALRCVASGVNGESLRATTQESNAAPVANADEQVQIHIERFGSGENPATAAVIISQFDCIRSAFDQLSQFCTMK
jgi:hypothetical protein